LNGNAWNTEIVDHSFFPLEDGHSIKDCKLCHKVDEYSAISSNCISCHQVEYNNTTNPNHKLSGFSTECTSCHTLKPGWKPVSFTDHDNNFFPVYSGKHKGVWNECAECHNNFQNFKEFTCISCHKNPVTNDNHNGISGYNYNDNACFGCHPTGDADMAFDHNTTHFPLTGAHNSVNCLSCHSNGYKGTSTVCADCHTTDFNLSANPNHTFLGLSKDCAACHTTSSGWAPASFPNHNNYYALNGAHSLISNNCTSCHNGNYINTSNTCVGCHNKDFTSTTEPNHIELQFSTDCASCHSESAWKPSTFNHDGLYFPVYTGKHQGKWSNCTDCHTSVGNWAQFTCITCHQNETTKDQHIGVSGYSYFSPACLACHPSGSADNIFDHNATSFPLTGAHASTQCLSCHSTGFAGTSTSCVHCHASDFNHSLNPNHPNLNINTDCAACHTTAPGWAPAAFPIHSNFYVIAGAHNAIANDCAACHNGNYNNTPNTCVGCHQTDFNNTSNPSHTVGQFPTTCTSCHTQIAWVPSTFNHNIYYPFTGTHTSIANNCILCHSNGYNNTPNTCAGCHQQDYNTAQNPNHISLNLSNNCVTCHTTAPGWAPASMPNHNTYFVITGAHASLSCNECHNGNYNNTPNTCYGCHTSDYTGTTQPNHINAQFPTDCVPCHTQSAWIPSTFNHDNMYFPIYTGTHHEAWHHCHDCHNNSNNYAIFSCIICHEHSNQSEVNHDHQGVNGYQYNSNACYACHPQGN
jgi:hypothetical protein